MVSKHELCHLDLEKKPVLNSFEMNNQRLKKVKRTCLGSQPLFLSISLP